MAGAIRRRLRFPSLSGVAWLCIVSVALGVFSLGHRAISQRRQARAVEWLQKAGVRVSAGSQPYWVPPVGSPRAVVGYDVRFPPSDEPLTPYEIECLLTLSGVRALDLSHNPVDDELARKIAGIRSLEHLTLCRTGLTDAGLREVARLPALRKLSIGATATTPEVVKSIEREKNLPGLYEEWVRWKFWELTGEAAGVSSTGLDVTPKTVLRSVAFPLLAELPDLRSLEIRQTAPIAESLVRELGEAGPFTSVRISGGVDRTNAAGLSGFRSAVEMTLQGPGIDDVMLQGVAGLEKLEKLSVVANELTGEGIGGLVRLPELRRLEIFAINGTTPPATGTIRLRLTPARWRAELAKRAAAAGPAYETLSRLPRLETVVLRNLPLNEVALRHLRQIATLRALVLSPSQLVTNEAVSELKSFGTHPRLEEFSLPTGLSRPQVIEIVEALRSAPALKVIRVDRSHRQIAGQLDRPDGLRVQVY